MNYLLNWIILFTSCILSGQQISKHEAFFHISPYFSMGNILKDGKVISSNTLDYVNAKYIEDSIKSEPYVISNNIKFIKTWIFNRAVKSFIQSNSFYYINPNNSTNKTIVVIFGINGTIGKKDSLGLANDFSHLVRIANNNCAHLLVIDIYGYRIDNINLAMNGTSDIMRNIQRLKHSFYQGYTLLKFPNYAYERSKFILSIFNKQLEMTGRGRSHNLIFIGESFGASVIQQLLRDQELIPDIDKAYLVAPLIVNLGNLHFEGAIPRYKVLAICAGREDIILPLKGLFVITKYFRYHKAIINEAAMYSRYGILFNVVFINKANHSYLCHLLDNEKLINEMLDSSLTLF